MRLRLKQARLLELLATSPLSQNHWAMKVGLSRGHWSEIVNGKHAYPSARTRVQMIDAFGVPVDELFEVESGVAPWADHDFRRALADRYLIDTELGQGGMGAVYLARDVRHGRMVAVKVISTEIVSGIGVDGFQREISTLAQLTHPNILPLFDSGIAAGFPFFVMPWIRGGSLRTRLRDQGRLSVRDTVGIATGIARALHHAHGDRVLHCDVKPENVLLFNRHAFVMDFGIARKLRAEIDDWSLRHELDFSAGTPAYVSPEQAAGQKDLDPRSDVYSLACLVFEMLAGRPPFEGTTTQAVVSRRFIVPPPPVRDFAPEVPAAVQSVIERAMALPREHRPSSAAEFEDELRLAAASTSRVFAGVSLAASRASRGVARALRMRSRHPIGGMFVDTINDLAVAWRGLRRAPGFAAIVVLTLGFALGANATMFGIVDRLLLRPPPHIAQPDEVHRVKVARFFNGKLGQAFASMSYAAFSDIRDRTSSFAHVAAMDRTTVSLGEGKEAQQLQAVLVTGQYFALLGAQPEKGRFINEDEARLPGASPVAVISYGLWQSRFAGASTIVGQTMRVDGRPYTIIGVAPRAFTGTELAKADVWLPLEAAYGPGDEWARERGWQSITTFVRVKNGVSDSVAGADLQRAYHTGHENFREYEAKAEARLGPLIGARDKETSSPAPRVAAWLLGMAVVVLLIACANIANLVLARGMNRRGEFAVRRALGVSAGRLVRQLLAESLLLGVLGSLAGIAIARWGGGLVRATLLPGTPWDASPVGARVLVVTAVATLLATVVAGLIPLWATSRTELAQTLRGVSRGIAGRPRRALTALLLVQTTLATALLVGAGLFVRSLWRVRSLDLGFSPQELLYVSVSVPEADTNPNAAREFYRQVSEHLETLAGVRAAGPVYGAPFMGNYAASVKSPGVDSIPRQPGGGPYYFRLNAGAMRALQLRLRKGRLFDVADDRTGAAPVVIVSEHMAAVMWPGKDPLAQCLIVFDRGCAQVVGVVSDIMRQGLREAAFLSFFVPYSFGDNTESPKAMVVRVDGAPAASVERIRREILSMRADLPFITVAPYQDLINPLARSWRLGATMFTVFGLLSVVMAAIGVYGVLSYSVSYRTQEIGVRSALGATPASVMRMIIGSGLASSLAGAVLGTAIALFAGRRLESLLFETSARDPVVLVTAGLVILIVTLAATIIPGRRAARVDPLAALRAE